MKARICDFAAKWFICVAGMASLMGALSIARLAPASPIPQQSYCKTFGCNKANVNMACGGTTEICPLKNSCALCTCKYQAEHDPPYYECL